MDKKENAILFATVDQEDHWVNSGLVFKVSKCNTYEDNYNELKDKLESDEVVQHVIEENCLEADLFDNDKTYKLKRTYWSYALVYEFENSEGDTVEFRLSTNHVRVMD